ncbi:hypothetical protein C357_03465 [Citreicella sp. 357]|nr:hypothetical protein C357_03465 [Citreicella sp. 357]
MWPQTDLRSLPATASANHLILARRGDSDDERPARSVTPRR